MGHCRGGRGRRCGQTAYQLIREQYDRRRYPPPGTMLEVDGRQVHLWRDDTAHGPLCGVRERSARRAWNGGRSRSG
ncbi:hypothetical protein GCM10022221_39500 [Actinocorallia aurea]